MKPKLSPFPISVTLTAMTPNNAYEIAHYYLSDILHENPSEAPWKLDEWRKALTGPTELYFLFSLSTRRNRFLRDLAKNGWSYEIFENPSA